ncbi:MAG: response regulator, partial [Geopsychrobacter sp.]|nr:response regulator [Geopsychrobacter sp.]
RLKENQYASLVENLKVGVFRISRGGQILSANLAFARMAGCANVIELKRHNVIGLYFNLEDRQQLIDALKANRHVENWDMQLRPIGEKEPIWVSLYVRLEGEGPDCYLEGLIEDITERKHSEEMLILSERMAAVGTMASGIAHEFNNIHTSVLGYAELGVRLEDISERGRTYFDTIRTSSLRARDLTSNLLGCSSHQSSKMAHADLNKTVRESFTLIEREFISDGVVIQSAFGEVPHFLMDRTQIGQVVLNFLINARHSVIGCPEKKISISSGGDQREAWVRVEDNGCGIPQDKLKKIFTPFFSTKGEYALADSPQATVRGSGLGLAVCHTIAKNHGGRIEVESRVGFGSSFALYLPMSGVRDEGSIGAEIAYPKLFVNPQIGGRILVIDDEENVRDLIRQTLTGQGYEVVTTDDGQEGLRIISDEGVDLVLVDRQMPKMNGLDFLCQLQRIEEPQRPLAMVVTGKMTDATASAQTDLDVYATLAKPFIIDELHALVHAALQQKRGTGSV